jgi:ribose transport system ATP-binding protein
MRGITKAFYGSLVLHDVDFEVRAGEVHALAGGNGAGKSTLMKILQGVHAPDAGEVLVFGRPTQLNSIQEAQAAGIGMVFQEFSLVPSLSVARNVFLNCEPRTRGGFLRDRESSRRAREVFADMGVDVDPDAPVSELGTAYWQLTEIAKALTQGAEVLIMDEPTASLAKHETEALFALIDRLRRRGIAVIYISHRMEEIYRISDRITILRDGRRLLTSSLAEVTPAQIVEGIVGRRVDDAMQYRKRDVASGEPVLEVRNLTRGRKVRDVSFTVAAGEILGLAGLMGSGRTELARCLFGIDRPDSGEIVVGGRRVDVRSAAEAVAAGIVLVPEDRRAQGLVLDHSVRDNLLLPLLSEVRRGGLIDKRRSRSLAGSLIDRFAVKVADPGRPVRLLSGGNQQKVVLAKWLGTDPKVLILDEPTAGVDIGTKTEILETVRSLADAGKAVVVISSEYPELLAVSDRVVVLREGAVADILDRGDIADEESLQLAVQGV